MSYEPYEYRLKDGEWDGGANYRPYAGCHIAAACREVAELVQKGQPAVTFIHNDVTLTARPGDTAESLHRRWEEERERLHQAYLKSPKYLQDQEAARRREEHDRAVVRSLMRELPSVAHDLPRLLDWLARLSNEGGSIYGMKEYDPATVAKALEDAGWEQNWGVGQNPEWFEGEPERMGQYIVGQGIDCMKKGMPPMEVTQTFVERYRAMQD